MMILLAYHLRLITYHSIKLLKVDVLFWDIHFDERRLKLLAHRHQSATVKIEPLSLPRKSLFHNLLHIGLLTRPVRAAAHGWNESKIRVFLRPGFKFTPVENVRFVAIPEDEPDLLLAVILIKFLDHAPKRRHSRARADKNEIVLPRLAHSENTI